MDSPPESLPRNLIQASKKYVNKLTVRQQYCLMAYTDNIFESLNKFLRDGSIDFFDLAKALVMQGFINKYANYEVPFLLAGQARPFIKSTKFYQYLLTDPTVSEKDRLFAQTLRDYPMAWMDVWYFEKDGYERVDVTTRFVMLFQKMNHVHERVNDYKVDDIVPLIEIVSPFSTDQLRTMMEQLAFDIQHILVNAPPSRIPFSVHRGTDVKVNYASAKTSTFTSTSLQTYVAMKFTSNENVYDEETADGICCLTTLRVPEGFPIFYIASNPRLGGGLDQEYEVILPFGLDIVFAKETRTRVYYNIRSIDMHVHDKLLHYGFRNWIVPPDDILKREFHVEHELKDLNLFQSEKQFMDAVKKADIVTVNPEMDFTIANRSRTKTFQTLVDLIKTYASYPQYRNEQTLQSIYDGFRNKRPMEYPIVVQAEDRDMAIFSGNTRMDVAFQLGIYPRVLLVKTS